ncbi:MAG: nitrogen regulation protein NR(II) [Halobacteriales archaeon]
MDALRRVIEASPDAVVLVDEDGVIREANRNVEAVLGYTRAELEGSVVEKLLLADDRAHHVQYREDYFADPEPRPMGRELDLHARRKDGTPVPVEISLGPIEWNGSRYVKATVADISRRKAMEDRLRRQAAQLEELVGIVSHDLRNPLNVAAGRLELARNEPDAEAAEQAQAALDRMETIIDDTLTLARRGRSVDPDATEPVPLSSLATESWSMVETADASLEVATDRPLEVDPGRVRHLFENLFRNAVVHAGDDAGVTVGTLDDGAGFYVEDDGPGVPADERDRVFEVGYTSHDGGTGFGLAIVRRVAEAHGWRVSVAEGSAGGARFEFRVADG